MGVRFEEIPFKLTVVTPVHVGTGETYVPTDYVIKGGYLYFVDRGKFMDFLIKKGKYEEFLNVCNMPSEKALFSIRSFLSKNFNASFAIYKVRVSPEVEENYKKNLENYAHAGSRIISQLEIYRIHRGLRNRAYIPGSSLKGSIRTAVLSYLADKKKVVLREKKGLFLEKEILGKRSPRDTVSDPFRGLKVRDLSLEKGKTAIGVARNVKRSGQSGKGRPVKMEYVRPGSVFSGVMLIDKSVFSKEFADITGVKVELTRDLIVDACRCHYGVVLEFERRNFGFDKLPNMTTGEGNSFPIKIGKHSGLVAVTVEKFREKNPRTTWVMDDTDMPMGWCEVELL